MKSKLLRYVIDHALYFDVVYCGRCANGVLERSAAVLPGILRHENDYSQGRYLKVSSLITAMYVP